MFTKDKESQEQFVCDNDLTFDKDKGKGTTRGTRRTDLLRFTKARVRKSLSLGNIFFFKLRWFVFFFKSGFRFNYFSRKKGQEIEVEIALE